MPKIIDDEMPLTDLQMAEVDYLVKTGHSKEAWKLTIKYTREFYEKKGGKYATVRSDPTKS